MTTTAPSTTAADHVREEGRVVAIAGPVIDVEFPPHALPEINFAVEFDIELDGHDQHHRGRGGPTDRRRPCPLHLHAADRRPGARRPGAQPGSRDPGAGGQRGARPRVQRAGRAARHRHHRQAGRLLGDPPQRAGLRPARAPGPDVRDRHQGHRPARALRAGWEDRPVRWGRRGQDGDHPRDDPPGGPGARWCLGVRRRGRAHP